MVELDAGVDARDRHRPASRGVALHVVLVGVVHGEVRAHRAPAVAAPRVRHRQAARVVERPHAGVDRGGLPEVVRLGEDDPRILAQAGRQRALGADRAAEDPEGPARAFGLEGDALRLGERGRVGAVGEPHEDTARHDALGLLLHAERGSERDVGCGDLRQVAAGGEDEDAAGEGCGEAAQHLEGLR